MKIKKCTCHVYVQVYILHRIDVEPPVLKKKPKRKRVVQTYLEDENEFVLDPILDRVPLVEPEYLEDENE
ncbi:unnamed protein product [Cuscuta campestris]|uniref:Uncharacterized protein n=1 Tax=Cuscuta campestris TaxID=132261 RepID=A0A484MNG2_9ASTE|nr:unnamed protein product [Cuscuta campestris]